MTGALDSYAGRRRLKTYFVSYTHSDLPWAEWIAAELENLGNETILQAWDFRPGHNFVLRMHEEIKKAEVVVLVLSPAYLSSAYCAAEWSAAFATDPTGELGRLLPVRVEDCQPDGILRPIVYVDLVGSSAIDAQQALRAAVSTGRALPASVSFPRAAPPTSVLVPFPVGPSGASVPVPASSKVRSDVLSFLSIAFSGIPVVGSSWRSCGAVPGRPGHDR